MSFASAVVVAAAALHWTSTAVGGSDEYCYVTSAGLLRQGRLVIDQAIVRQSPWPFASGTWTPIGYTEVPGDPDLITPVCPPGLPLLMAALQAPFGYCGAFWVVPVCAGAVAWLTYVLGLQAFARRDLALAASLLMATSPTFLNQATSPVSDVPATAAWTLALVLLLADWPILAGAAVAVAILIRPNLVPLSLALLFWTMLVDRRNLRSTTFFMSPTIRVAAALAPAVIAIAWLNTHLYGSPLRSGYGQLRDLYSWRYIWTNAAHFTTWTVETDTPVVALAGLFFVAPRLLPPVRIPFLRVLFGAFVVIVVLSYLFYLPFEAWWFLRFLLPMWPILMLLTVAGLDGIISRAARPHGRRVAMALVVIVLAVHGAMVANNRGTFAGRAHESRYVAVARYISGSTDPSAVFLSWQESGSIRLYSGRLTLNFARVDRQWLDRTVDRLHAMGRHPYFVIEEFERESFRQRFRATNRLGELDWPPIAVFEDRQVAVYDPIARNADAAPFVIASRDARSEVRCRAPAGWPPRVRLH